MRWPQIIWELTVSCTLDPPASHSECVRGGIYYYNVTEFQNYSPPPPIVYRTRRLPVLYVFGLEAMDVSVCVTAFRQLFTDTEDRILVLYHTSYSHCIGECTIQHGEHDIVRLFLAGGLEEALTSDYSNCVFSSLVVPVSDRTSDVSMGTEPRTACNCSQGASSDDADSRTCVERDTLIGNKDQVEDTATPITEAAPVISPPNDVTDSTYHRYALNEQGVPVNCKGYPTL